MVVGKAREVLDHGQAERDSLASTRARLTDDITPRKDVVVRHRLFPRYPRANTRSFGVQRLPRILHHVVCGGTHRVDFADQEMLRATLMVAHRVEDYD